MTEAELCEIENRRTEDYTLSDYAQALRKDVFRLAAEVRRLTTCHCGRPLSPGLCNVHDNDC